MEIYWKKRNKKVKKTLNKLEKENRCEVLVVLFYLSNLNVKNPCVIFSFIPKLGSKNVTNNH